MEQWGKKMGNFDNGIIRSGTTIGDGEILGNIFQGVIKDGDGRGVGNTVGNVKQGVVKDADGNALFNVKRGMVRNGHTAGSGIAIGKIGEFSVSGMQTEPADEMVAAYHFFVNKIV